MSTDNDGGVSIQHSNYTVILIGASVIRRLMESTKVTTFEGYSKVAQAIVTAHGFSLGDKPERWALGTANEADLTLLNSYLDPEEYERMEIVDFKSDGNQNGGPKKCLH